MTVKQSPPTALDKRSGKREARERGLALAAALLEKGRALTPLSGVAHAQVKRRLAATARRRIFRRVGWLRPALIVSVCLVCGAAFGIALDRLVLKRGVRSLPAPSDVGGGSARPRARSGKPSAMPPQTSVAEAAPAATGLVAVPPVQPAPSGQPAPPTTRATDPTFSETASFARTPSHARKLAMRAEPSAIASPPLSSRPDMVPVAPVAPSGPASGWPASAAPAERAPAPDRQIPALPAPVTASPPAAASTRTAPRESSSEERLLAAAVRALRAKADPRSALGALDEYGALYPQGRLFVEAQILRVDALTALHDAPEALRVLDGLDFARMPGGLDRQLQRAELRAAAGRVEEAEADFAGVILHEGRRDSEVLERALWLRARARASRGDTNAARLDASEYLRRFPSGRFAAQAARLGGAAVPVVPAVP
jgi:hypothetical protein